MRRLLRGRDSRHRAHSTGAKKLVPTNNQTNAHFLTHCTIIIQAISYAQLAKVPTINALYASILPGAVYVIFGTSMHLDLGPVAVLSILTGQLVTRYGVTPYSQDAVDLAGEAALAVGTIFCALSIFNVGDLMRFVSYPVMVNGTTSPAFSLQ